MKKRLFGLALLAGVAGTYGYARKELVKGLIKLELPESDFYTRIEEEGNFAYLCKNNDTCEEMFLDFVAQNGWEKADQVGEGFFFLNEKQETLLLNRNCLCGGRYLVWRASRPIES